MYKVNADTTTLGRRLYEDEYVVFLSAAVTYLLPTILYLETSVLLDLPKNPYFEPFLWPNHPFLGLATFNKVDSLKKMSRFSFIKLSQKLGP